MKALSLSFGCAVIVLKLLIGWIFYQPDNTSEPSTATDRYGYGCVTVFPSLAVLVSSIDGSPPALDSGSTLSKFLNQSGSKVSLNSFLNVAAQLKKSMDKKKLCFTCGQTAGPEQVTHLEEHVVVSTYKLTAAETKVPEGQISLSFQTQQTNVEAAEATGSVEVTLVCD